MRFFQCKKEQDQHRAILTEQELILLYRHECFTGKYTTRNIHKKLHPGPEWFIFHNLTREFIDDVISVISLRNFITYHFLEFYLHIFQSFAYILSL